jgi:translocation and assembly module TamB
MPKPRRFARTALSSLGLVAVFVAGTTVGAVAHLDRPAGRRLVAQLVNQVLDPLFKGKLIIEKIGKIELAVGRVDGIDAHLVDAEGNTVITARGISVQLSVPVLLASLRGTGPIRVLLGRAHVDSAEGLLREDASGTLSIASAFDSPPSPTPTTAGRDVVIELTHLSVGHAHAQGVLSGQPIDADVDGVEGDLRSDPQALTANTQRFPFHARALPIPEKAAEGVAEGHVVMPSDPAKPRHITASAELKTGELRATATASLDGDQVKGHVTVPKVAGTALAAVVEGVPITVPVAATVDLSGELSALRATAHVDVGTGSADITGSLRSRDRIEAEAKVTFAHVTLQDVAPAAPAGQVDGGAEGTLSMTPGGPIAARYSAHTEPTTIADQAVPAIVTSGTFDGTRLAGTADVAEPGAPTKVAYTLAPEKGRTGVEGLDLDVQTAVASLGKVPRLKALIGPVGGGGTAHVRGHLTLDDRMAVSADVSVKAQGLQRGPNRVGSVGVEAKIQGTVTAPQIRATVAARGVEAGGQHLATVAVTASGNRGAASVKVDATTTDGDTVDASARLLLGSAVAARDVRVRAVRNHEEITAEASAVQVRGGAVSVDDLVVHGAGGDIQASVSSRGGALRLKMHGTQLKLSRIAALAKAADPDAVEGFVAIDADLTGTTRGATGFVNVLGRDLGGGEVHGGSLDLRSIFDGRKVTVQAEGEAPGIARLKVATSDVTLGPGGLDLAAVLAATGALELIVEAGDLARIASLLPAGTLPVAQVGGAATLTVNATRQGTALPDVALTLATHDLAARMPDEVNKPGQELKGVDLDLRVDYAAARGHVAVDFSGHDARGPLATIHAEATPPFASLINEPARRREVILAMPLEIKATVPRRAIVDLPVALRLNDVKGELSLDLTASGTVRDPKIHVVADGHGIERKIPGATSTPMDLHLDGAFASSRADATLGLSVQGRTMLTARTEGAVTMSDLIEGRAGGPRWKGGTEIRLDAMPLRLVSAMVNQPIAGCATGVVTIRGLHEDASVDANVRIAGLRVGPVIYRDAVFTGKVAGGAATAEVKIEQTDGSLEAKGKVGLTWGSALLPKLDGTKDADVSLDARAFRLAVLRPFVRTTLGQVDGLLDANLRYRIEPGDASHGKMQGQLTVRDGVVDAAMLGQELRAIQATVSATPAGEIKLTDASARGISGRLTLDGVAHLDAWKLKDASAALHIVRKETMVLTYQGVEIGEAWGDVSLKAQGTDRGGLAIDVQVPKFDLELPDTSSRSTQDLEDDPAVRIGTQADNRFVDLPIHAPDEDASRKGPTPEATSVTVKVALGREVRIHHSNQLDVWLNGGIEADVGGNKVGVSGTVNVDRGYVELQGRRFTIDHATASFDPSRAPSDPTVRATATYQAPESTRIIADFSGTASAGKLTLHSDPALSQSELLSLIVFGSKDGAVPARQNTGDPNNAARAAGIGGGVLTQGLNKALSQVSPVDVTTRVDTTDSQNPRPELSVAISRKVSASVSYRLGLASPGQNPDRTTLKLDYRFRPRWSLETSVGDAGTSIVDVLWKMRY